MTATDVEKILNNLKTPEGKLHFLKKELAQGDQAAAPYVHSVVEELARSRASVYSNGNPVWEAGKIYEEMGLLEDALVTYVKFGSLSKAADISKKLGRTKDAQGYFSQFIKKDLKRREASEKKGVLFAEGKRDYYLRLSKEAESFGLQDKSDELFVKAVEFVEKSFPLHALELVEGRKNVSVEMRNRILEKAAKEEESRGNFERAAELSRKAGLEEQAKMYEEILSS